MKTSKIERTGFNRFKYITGMVLTLLLSVMMFSACENNGDFGPKEDILPENFSVNIPNAISDEDGASNARYNPYARTASDTLQGDDIYQHLTTFIHVGEFSAELVEAIIGGVRHLGINGPLVLSYQSDEDGRTKNLVVVENSDFDGETWEYELTITDADSETNPDGGKAMQIFWNRSPVKGIAILKPYNINREENPDPIEAIVRIDYSEGGEHGYDAHMIVTIDEFPMPDPLEDPWALNTLKMFVGATGDQIDVYGNSNHPNAILIAGNAGFNWAFVASGNDAMDIGAAEVGLPPSNLDEPSRSVLLEFYSIKNVFTREINEVWPGLDQDIIDAYLVNTEGPGFFGPEGFITGGTSPGPDHDVLAERLQNLSPYNPKEISNLNVSFK